MVRGWLEGVNDALRTEEPASELKIALQCGGSGRLLRGLGEPARRVGLEGGREQRRGREPRRDGRAHRAERYVLANVRDAQTARRFLRTVERFKERAGWHGHTAEDNPSGGNNYRGLYNISHKIHRRARKKDPDVRVTTSLTTPRGWARGGFYHGQPRNDLGERRRAGCRGANAVFFTTGNGSITNFPFVPTIKVVTTTGRFNLLSKDMDVNAGAYLDGTPELGREMFERTLRAASGETDRRRGGRARPGPLSGATGSQTSSENLEELENAPEPDGEPQEAGRGGPPVLLPGDSVQRGPVADQVGLVMPTSLCSGQICKHRQPPERERCHAGEDNALRRPAPHRGLRGLRGLGGQIYSRTVLGHPRTRPSGSPSSWSTAARRPTTTISRPS